MRWLTIVVAAAVSAAVPCHAQDKREVAFPEYGLKLTLPELEGLAGTGGTTAIHTWTGKLAGSTVTIRLDFMERKAFRLDEPSDVMGVVKFNRERVIKGFKFAERSLRKGAYGFVPYASVARSEERPAGATTAVGENWFLGGILKQHGYSIDIAVRPALSKAKAKPILEFLEKGVKYDGEVRDGSWKKDRCTKRWERDAPDSIKKKLKIIRTKHYVILTNSSGGRLFAKKMEQFYDKVRKVFPFEEVDAQELMPVFLFRQNEEYFKFYEKMFKGGSGRNSKGHAWKDYYATWYESPNDPTHIHEATHQIFANRLYLGGGGSWYQEGVAEYMSTSKNERNTVRRQIARGTFTPLKKFVTIPSLLNASGGTTKTGRNLGTDNYTQAALLIEFLRDSKFAKKKFQEFIHEMGQVQRGDLKNIDAVFMRVYGKGLDDIEKAFVKYCKR